MDVAMDTGDSLSPFFDFSSKSWQSPGPNSTTAPTTSTPYASKGLDGEDGIVQISVENFNRLAESSVESIVSDDGSLVHEQLAARASPETSNSGTTMTQKSMSTTNLLVLIALSMLTTPALHS